jgi:hypothetical protein
MLPTSLVSSPVIASSSVVFVKVRVGSELVAEVGVAMMRYVMGSTLVELSGKAS